MSQWYLQIDGIVQVLRQEKNSHWIKPSCINIKGAIIIEENGKGSNTKFMKSANLRYLFIKDWLAKGSFSIEYLPTEKWQKLVKKASPRDFF